MIIEFPLKSSALLCLFLGIRARAHIPRECKVLLCLRAIKFTQHENVQYAEHMARTPDRQATTAHHKGRHDRGCQGGFHLAAAAALGRGVTYAIIPTQENSRVRLLCGVRLRQHI